MNLWLVFEQINVSNGGIRRTFRSAKHSNPYKTMTTKMEGINKYWFTSTSTIFDLHWDAILIFSLLKPLNVSGYD